MSIGLWLIATLLVAWVVYRIRVAILDRRERDQLRCRMARLEEALREAKGMLDAMPREHNDHSLEQYRYCVACAVSRTLELARAALGEKGGER